MANDAVILNGVAVGHIKVVDERTHRHPSRRVSVTIAFKPDRIGMMHAVAREMDRER